MKLTKGFTLVELLVAVGIIIVLATIGAVTYMPAVKHSRDGQRKTDLEKVRSALAIYYSNNDSYPTILNTGAGRLTDSRGNIYLETIPRDPKSEALYEYKTNSSNTCFWLKASLEREQCYVVTGGDEADCPRQCEVASNCWGVRGFRCDPECKVSLVNSNSVYQTCSSASCFIGGCWAIGGGCNGGCSTSSVWSTTAYTSCSSSPCGYQTGWFGSGCYVPTGDKINPYDYPRGPWSGCALFKVGGCPAGDPGINWIDHGSCNSCRGDGTGHCYEGRDIHSVRGRPAGYLWVGSEFTGGYCDGYISGGNAWGYSNIRKLYWQSCSTNVSFNASGATAVYNGSGGCSGSGSGNCYKLTGSGGYYTGGSGCGGGGCGSGTYFSGYQQCTWKPSYGNTYSVSGLTTAYSGSSSCSGDGSGTCYKLTGGSTYYTGGSGCGGSRCSGGTYYSGSQRCQWYR